MSFDSKTVISNDTEISIAQLQTAVAGRVILPGDAEYDAARTVFYGGFDHHPAAIVQVTDAHDVATVIGFARDQGLELAVRSGGHSVAGHGGSDGGIVIDLSRMKGLDIDVEARTAWAESGLTAGEYTKAAGKYGLATGFGDTGSVGIGGITLGGGVGYFVRKYGLTIDDLLAAEIVTADGQILQIDEHNHADLFWAIRGGGGNFGVVTRFKFRLHEVDEIVGGMLFLPATPENVSAFAAAAEAAPEELSTIFAVVAAAPPMPFIPAEQVGKPILMAFIVYAGDIEAGQRAVAPFRAIATPLADMVRPMKYPEMYPPEEAYHPLAASRTMFLDHLDQSKINSIFEHLQSAKAKMAVVQLRVLGGAMARVPAEATAFAHRNRKLMANVAALYENPDETAQHEAWVAAVTAGLQAGDTAGAYVNFLGHDGKDRIREAYPGATWDRLTAIKARYDPTNLFRLNQNIQPSAAN